MRETSTCSGGGGGSIRAEAGIVSVNIMTSLKSMTVSISSSEELIQQGGLIGKCLAFRFHVCHYPSIIPGLVFFHCQVSFIRHLNQAAFHDSLSFSKQ